MAVLRESPWYEEIKQEGIEIGEQRGKLAAVPILVELGLSAEEIAQRLTLTIEQVAQVLDPES
ncbi:MAG: hypothetical protein Q6M54_06055 [Thermostichus sp. DRC_bins_24]